ncbi:hypothetical protein MY1884_008620 [Beauveria asiatica]
MLDLEQSAEETRLYKKFIGHQAAISSRSSARGGHNSLSPQDRIETAELLREIKDIRDELKMLRVIAETQQSIQEEFRDFVRITPRTLAYKDVADELREMDKALEQIATSISITLNPQQNAAAIAQTDAAVYQGQITRLFTAVTIVFVGDVREMASREDTGTGENEKDSYGPEAFAQSSHNTTEKEVSNQPDTLSAPPYQGSTVARNWPWRDCRPLLSLAGHGASSAAAHWYRKLFHKHTRPDTFLPETGSTSAARPPNHIDMHSNRMRESTPDIWLAQWPRAVRQWFTARWPQSTPGEGSHSPPASPSGVSSGAAVFKM